MAVVAWLASKQIDGWGWILFISIVFFGNVGMSNKPDIAECPDCGKTFKVECDDSEGS